MDNAFDSENNLEELGRNKKILRRITDFAASEAIACAYGGPEGWENHENILIEDGADNLPITCTEAVDNMSIPEIVDCPEVDILCDLPAYLKINEEGQLVVDPNHPDYPDINFIDDDV